MHYKIELWRYPPLFINLDCNGNVELVYKHSAGNGSRWKTVTVQDATHVFSGINSWSDKHDNIEIQAMMDEAAIPPKFRSKVLRFLSKMQSEWKGFVPATINIDNVNNGNDMDELLNIKSGLNDDDCDTDEDIDIQRYGERGSDVESSQAAKKDRKRKRSKKRKKSGLSKELRRKIKLLETEDFEEPFEWLVEFVEDKCKGDKPAKRANKSNYTRWVRSNYGAGSEEKAMKAWKQMVEELLTQEICEYKGLSFYWQKLSNGASCVHTDGTVPPKTKRRKKSKGVSETTDNREEVKQDETENKDNDEDNKEQEVESESVEHGENLENRESVDGNQAVNENANNNNDNKAEEEDENQTDSQQSAIVSSQSV